jgi:hypothetical protein
MQDVQAKGYRVDMNVLVCGRMKEGKTTLALWIARHWQQGGAVAWDPRHMIDAEMARSAGFEGGVVYVNDGNSLQEAIETYEEHPGALIVYRPSSVEMENDFNELCSVLLDPPERYHNWSLIVDEAAQLQSSYKIVPQLSRAIRQHPRSVLIVQTTHSLQDWHRASKDLTNHLFCFRLVGRSLKAVIEFCDGSEEMEGCIKNLEPHHCVHISFESQAGAQEYTLVEPESWYGGDGDTETESRITEGEEDVSDMEMRDVQE